MTFDFYSIGDSAFLEQILNAIAALSGTGDMKMVAMIGMLFGVLLVAFEAVVNNQNINWMKAIIGWVVYLLIFGNTATVAINDQYTGQVRLVANVPFGIAATGSWVSAIGITLTEKFEQEFSLPRMTSDGFASAVKQLLSVRDLELMGDAANGGAAGVDYQRTLYNYLRDCTLVGIDMGLIDKIEFLHTDDALTAMLFDNNIYGTKTFLPGDALPGGTFKGCLDAHADIKKAMNDAAFDTALSGLMAQRMGLSSTGPANAYGVLQNDLDALVGVGKDARLYVRNALIKNLVPKADVGKAITDGDIAAATLITQATEQLRVQHAAEGSMFMRVVHPLMTFMEGFVFAISPIVMFLVANGSMGIGLAGKYLMLLLWVQLWMPVMAIVNLYLNMTVQGKMAILSTGANLSPTSIMGQIQAHATMADWLGTAGMLAAATPAFAMMLIYGSSVAATHLAGRLSSTDTIDEKQVAPDLMKNQGVLNMQSSYGHNLTTGLLQTGAEAVNPSVDLKAGMQSTVQSAQSNVEAATNQLQTVASHSTGVTDSQGHSVSVAESLVSGTASQYATSAQYAKTMAMKDMEGTSWSQDKRDDVATKVGLGMASGKGYVASLEGAIGSTFGTTDSESARQALENARSTEKSENVSATFTDKLTHDLKDEEVRSAMHNVSESDMEQYSRAASNLSTAQKQYSRASAAMQTYGQRGTYKWTDMGNKVTEATAQELKQQALSAGVGAQAERYADRMLSQFGGNKDRAMAVGAQRALYDKALATHDVGLMNRTIGNFDKLGVNDNIDQYQGFNPGQFAGVGQNANGPVPTGKLEKQDAAGFMKKNAPVDGEGAVDAHNAQHQALTNEQGGAWLGQQRMNNSDQLINKMRARQDNMSTAEEVHNGLMLAKESFDHALRTSSTRVEGTVAGITAFGSVMLDAAGRALDGEKVDVNQVLTDGFAAFMREGAGTINEKMEAIHQGFYEVGKNQYGLTDAQAKLYADSAMSPVMAGLSDKGWNDVLQPIMGKYDSQVDSDQQAVANEIGGVFRNTDGTTDTSRSVPATEAIEEQIKLAATTGDSSRLGMVQNWNGIVGLGK